MTSASVGRLTEAFRVPLVDGAGPPAVTGAGLFVGSGLSIRAFAPDDGATRWTATLLQPSGSFDSISDPFVSGDDKRVFASAVSPLTGPSDLVTLVACTGSEQRQGYPGELQSLRGTKVGSAYRSDPGELPTTMLVSVRDLQGGSSWGGLTPEAGGSGVASLGDSLLYVATGDQILAYDPATPCQPFSPSRAVSVSASGLDRSRLRPRPW